MMLLRIFVEGAEKYSAPVERDQIPHLKSDLEANRKDLRAFGPFSVFVQEGENIFHLIGGEIR